MHRFQALGLKKGEGVGNAAGVAVVGVNVSRTPMAGPLKGADLAILRQRIGLSMQLLQGTETAMEQQHGISRTSHFRIQFFPVDTQVCHGIPPSFQDL